MYYNIKYELSFVLPIREQYMLLKILYVT